MNTLLWILQIILAIVYVVSGAQKSTQSKERMIATGQTGVRDYSLSFIRFIATCELLGAVGLILPRALDVLPILTPIAALGLAIVMVGAARAHTRLHELRNVAINLVLIAALAFVAIGRFLEG
jgi:uncharacterized membrane protein YphA (DoxX/SURF4 family)